MSFVCQICDPPYEFDRIDEDDGTCHAIFFIGHDEVASSIYFVRATLSPYEEGVPEFSFCVMGVNTETGEPIFFTNGRDTKPIFSGVERHLVMEVVMRATAAVLAWQSPRKIYRCTADKHPPERALVKHDLISWVFNRAGYKLTRCDQWHGQRIWFAERQDHDCAERVAC